MPPYNNDTILPYPSLQYTGRQRIEIAANRRICTFLNLVIGRIIFSFSGCAVSEHAPMKVIFIVAHPEVIVVPGFRHLCSLAHDEPARVEETVTAFANVAVRISTFQNLLFHDSDELVEVIVATEQFFHFVFRNIAELISQRVLLGKKIAP